MWKLKLSDRYIYVGPADQYVIKVECVADTELQRVLN